MSSGYIAGVPGLTPRVASSAMAMVTARVEKEYHIMAFSDDFIPLSISPKQRLDDIVKYTDNLGFSGTDCALPMLYALKHKIPIDVFAVYTDSETWAGKIHPIQALNKYRREMNIPAKLLVVGCTATEFSIADPNDAGMMDVVGFSTDTPNIMSMFAQNKI
jgi:60 kDa SS-A/Ro ribonucleoprotein